MFFPRSQVTSEGRKQSLACPRLPEEPRFRLEPRGAESCSAAVGQAQLLLLRTGLLEASSRRADKKGGWCDRCDLQVRGFSGWDSPYPKCSTAPNELQGGSGLSRSRLEQAPLGLYD